MRERERERERESKVRWMSRMIGFKEKGLKKEWIEEGESVRSRYLSSGEN